MSCAMEKARWQCWCGEGVCGHVDDWYPKLDVCIGVVLPHADCFLGAPYQAKAYPDLMVIAMV